MPCYNNFTTKIENSQDKKSKILLLEMKAVKNDSYRNITDLYDEYIPTVGSRVYKALNKIIHSSFRCLYIISTIQNTSFLPHK